MEREKIDNLYELLEDFYYSYKDELWSERFIDFITEEEYIDISFAEILTALQEKIQEKLSINSCWNIKK